MAGHLSKAREGSPIRTFLAISLPEPQRAALSRLERDFDLHTSILKWVAPNLLHITVKFLDGVDASRLEAVDEAARQGAASTGPFSLALDGLGAFPSVRGPRVIWAGLKRDAGFRALALLFTRLEEALEMHGFPREARPFSPHITLARVRDAASSLDRGRVGESLARVQEKRALTAPFSVRDLVVMRSDLGPAGPSYTPMAVLPLGTEGAPAPYGGQGGSG